LPQLARRAGLVAITRSTAALSDNLNNLAIRTGVSIATLQSLSDVAGRAGVSQNALAASLGPAERRGW
jgi:hypothetical protein